MEIFQVVSLGIVATIISLVIKSYRPEISIQISIVTGVMIFVLIAANFSTIFKFFEEITSRVNLDIKNISTVIKVIGISYVTEFGAQVCKDAGESAIASKIELAGKVLIVVIAIPVIMALFNLLIDILP